MFEWQGFLELWGEGETWEELEAAVSSFPEKRKQQWLTAGRSMKVLLDAFEMFVVNLMISPTAAILST